ncbi:hypothetical protein EXIGLDRAFT_614208 [Exidia glandulosa HHB12029]|uniref:Tetraspanin Tsp2 n=1 Tax=Exidia glandulosa HHB12029 TaxID=1314781 RepID=A0A165HWM2_EXIGL|nr:hypothetical protein EXIGLDRAFT_614208 [Exidia glandulosa HHB12029]
MQSIALWTWSKWILLVSVTTVFAYGIVGFTLILLTWFQGWLYCLILSTTDHPPPPPVLISATLLLLLTSMLGLSGTLLNSRPILAFYAILLFPAFIALLIPAYVSYKRATFDLERKMNLAWSEWWDDRAKSIVQNSLRCCGYYSPLHQAVFSKRCYPRVPPSVRGCKAALVAYESWALRKTYTALFALVPLHLVNIIVALLCANHVTSTFGKGLTPTHYRLTYVFSCLSRANSEFCIVRRM